MPVCTHFISRFWPAPCCPVCPLGSCSYFPRFGVKGFEWRNRAGAETVTRLVDLQTGDIITEPGAQGEVSGHYHPKASIPLRGRTLTRPVFLYDSDRLILPAYGTYTGGLRSHDMVLTQLMRPDASAILTGPKPVQVPMPRGAA